MIEYQPDKYWEDRLTKHFSLRGVGFLNLGLEYNKWLYKTRLRMLGKFIKKHHISTYGKRILDIGVGTGFYIDFWERQGVRHIAGLDITQKSISELENKYPQHSFIRGDIAEELCFGQKFDIITCFDILFHIVENDKFDQAIRNIKSFSHRNTWILISDLFLNEYKPPAFHENDRTLIKYKWVLEANDLQIVDIHPIFYLSSTPVDANAIKSKSLQLILRVLWSIVYKVLYYSNHNKLKNAGGERIGFVLGWLLYHVDGIILRFVKTGPSTKLLLAQAQKDQ
ncbi:class I SAM-dependent methyltransferase [Thermodesulfobacteriota bacterium]